jgi:prepilin-type processing-associated H-X9-DG protein
MSTTPHPGVAPLDYQSQTKKPKRPNWLLQICITAVIVVGGIATLMPSLCKSRETANKAKCSSNLHQIGLAISLYAQDHGGQYPDSIASIMREEQLTSAVFVCPSSNDEAADGDSQAAVIANMTKPHHISYVYIGTGLTTRTVTDETVVAYELPENHRGDGMNMLFGDGHVEWETMPAAKALLIKVAPSTQPSSSL